MGDIGDYWRDHRDYARSKQCPPTQVVSGVRHKCGGRVELARDGFRFCSACDACWVAAEDIAEMQGERMGGRDA